MDRRPQRSSDLPQRGAHCIATPLQRGPICVDRPLSIAPPRVPALGRLLVPLDGSPRAEHALPHAIQLASLAGATLRLAFVPPGLDPAFRGRQAASYAQFDTLLRRPHDQYLADLERRIARSSDVALTSTVLDGRYVADALSEMVRSSADLVVMAARGRSMALRLLTGSIADALLDRTPTPLLLVRGYNCPVDLTARPLLRRALAPVDGSSGSTAILPPLAAIARLSRAEPTLLRIVRAAPWYSHFLQQLPGDDCPPPRDHCPLAALDALADHWGGDLPRVRTSIVWTDAPAANEILAQALQRDVDLIALALRPRSLWRRSARAGVSARLRRRAAIPLLLVRQPPAS